MQNRRSITTSLILTLLLVAAGPSIASASGLYIRSATGLTQATKLGTEIQIGITGIVARVTVAQRYRNDGADWVEGVYVFPLPDDAAVDRMTLVIGDRRIEGEIQEREQARRTYERARDAGQQASLVEQERPNLFTTSVANIAPGEEITVEIGFQQSAHYDQGAFSLRLPLTLTPRFIPGASLGSASGTGLTPDTTAVPDASRITPPVLDAARADTNRSVIDVSLDAGLPLVQLASPSHAMITSRDGYRYRLTTAERDVAMDRDFEVAWRFVPAAGPRAIAFTEAHDGESYVLLMLLPPTSAELPQPAPREVLFVIDTSGSMGGASIEQARTALSAGLGRLTGADRFNVIEFNTDVQPLFAAPVSWSPQALQQAQRFVAGLSANGGTNIGAAIANALGQAGTPGYLRQIVFLTDGSVGNEAELFQMINDDLGDARLFTIGIGSAPNTHFMRKAAQFGRGSYSHIARTEDVEPGMRRLFDKLEHVALQDISIAWPNAAEIYPARVPDLYRGEPVVVTAKLAQPLTNTLQLDVSGQIGDNVGYRPWAESILLEPGYAPGISALWARRKIEALLDRRLDGTSETEIRAAVLDVALKHGLLSPYTSLVAVDRTPQRSLAAALRREALGSLAPAGSNFAPFPATATASRLLQLLGTVLTCLVLGLAGIWWLIRRAER